MKTLISTVSTWETVTVQVTFPMAGGEVHVQRARAQPVGGRLLDVGARLQQQPQQLRPVALARDVHRPPAAPVDGVGGVRIGARREQQAHALSQKLNGMNENKAHLTKELEAVNTYLKDLEPACVSGDSSYAERKAARADEIAALRKAQGILEEAFNPAGFLQKK